MQLTQHDDHFLCRILSVHHAAAKKNQVNFVQSSTKDIFFKEEIEKCFLF